MSYLEHKTNCCCAGCEAERNSPWQLQQTNKGLQQNIKALEAENAHIKGLLERFEGSALEMAKSVLDGALNHQFMAMTRENEDLKKCVDEAKHEMMVERARSAKLEAELAEARQETKDQRSDRLERMRQKDARIKAQRSEIHQLHARLRRVREALTAPVEQQTQEDGDSLHASWVLSGNEKPTHRYLGMTEDGEALYALITEKVEEGR